MAEPNELHVVFGTAALGQAVMRELLRRGKRVRMVSRRDRLDVPDAVEVVKGDATDPESTRAACRNATVVYNCAAPPYTKWEALYPAMQNSIIDGAAAGDARIVSAENMYVYGAVSEPMVESMPHNAHTRKGRIRAQMSAELMDAHRSGRVRAAIGRAPDYYGPLAVITTIYGGRVFYRALAGKKVSVQGDLDAPHTMIYVDDFAKGLVTLGEREEALGQTWHLPSPPAITQRAFVSLIFEAAGREMKVGTTPPYVFRVLGRFVPIMRELDEMQYQWEQPYFVNHDRFEKAFGCDVIPHKEGVRQTVDWFRRNPA